MKKILIFTLQLLYVSFIFSQGYLLNTKQFSSNNNNKRSILQKCEANLDVNFVDINLDNIHKYDSLLVSINNDNFWIQKNKFELKDNDHLVFVGKGENSQVVISKLSNDIQGVIEFNNNVYTIETIENEYVLITTDYQFLKEGCEIIEATIDNNQFDHIFDKDTSYYSQFNETANQNNSTCNIRVLVFYTNNAENSVSNIKNTILTAVELTNQSFLNSQIDARIDLTFAGKTNYVESGNIETDLSRFRIDKDGYMDEVHRIREEYSADICVLLLYTPSLCGLASDICAVPSNAFCAVSTYSTCATSNYSFAHEIGHLLGCRHNIEADPSSTPFSYGHGYIHPNTKWRTMMSISSYCNNCPRLLYWSNPNIFYQNEYIGESTKCNNSLVWSNRNPIVATFRQPKDTILVNDLINNTLVGCVVAKNYISNNNILVVNNSSSLQLLSGYEIELKNGFYAEEGSSFYASIDAIEECDASDFAELELKKQKKYFANNNSYISYQIYPNPTSNEVSIDYSLQKEGVISIDVFDELGHFVKSLLKGNSNIGNYSHRCNISNLRIGIYFIVINYNNERFIEKIILNR